ncbi:hypothetical protein [Nonomuraea sp. NPDC049400]|uniref:hypothetical protein n=1 Tax=Nonomuraea sp. NPDC049400 TaxID=3364352 RepID=UPI0037AEDCFF
MDEEVAGSAVAGGVLLGAVFAHVAVPEEASQHSTESRPARAVVGVSSALPSPEARIEIEAIAAIGASSGNGRACRHELAGHLACGLCC